MFDMRIKCLLSYILNLRRGFFLWSVFNQGHSKWYDLFDRDCAINFGRYSMPQPELTLQIEKKKGFYTVCILTLSFRKPSYWPYQYKFGCYTSDIVAVFLHWSRFRCICCVLNFCSFVIFTKPVWKFLKNFRIIISCHLRFCFTVFFFFDKA